MPLNEFDSVQKYIEDMGTVYPAVEGRITMIAAEPGAASRLTVSLSMVFVAVIAIFNQFYG